MEHLLHLAVGHILLCITPVHAENTPTARKDDKDELDNKTSTDAATSDEGSTILSHALHKLLGLIMQVCILYCVCYIH